MYIPKLELLIKGYLCISILQHPLLSGRHSFTLYSGIRKWVWREQRGGGTVERVGGEEVMVAFEPRASVPYFVFWSLYVPSQCFPLSGLPFSFQPPWALSASLSTVWARMPVKCSAGQASGSLLIGFCDLPTPRTHRHKRLTGELRSPALAMASATATAVGPGRGRAWTVSCAPAEAASTSGCIRGSEARSSQMQEKHLS